MLDVQLLLARLYLQSRDVAALDGQVVMFELAVVHLRGVGESDLAVR